MRAGIGIGGRIGIFLVVTPILCVIGGILESNIVQGEYKDKYGTVKVPGSKVIHLPAGTTDVVPRPSFPVRETRRPPGAGA